MRILALTTDVSLLTALSSMMREWEITSVKEASQAQAVVGDAALALVDFGTTERGLEAVARLRQDGIAIPSLVIGDAPPPVGALAPVLARPFTLLDLTRAAEEALTWIPPAVEMPAAETPGAGAPASAEQEAEPTESAAPADAPPAEPGPAGKKSEHEKRKDRVAEELLAELADEVRSHEEEEEASPSETAEQGPAADNGGPATRAHPAAPTVAPAPAKVEHRPAPQPPMPPRATEMPRVAEPAATVEDDAAAPVRTPERQSQARGEGLRRFLRRPARQEAHSQKDPAETDPMVARLRAAIKAGRELEALLDEVSALAQPRAMAHAFLGGVLDLFKPQIAAVYAPATDGTYVVIASHGLSTVEAGMRVMPEQPLFLEVATGLQAILIAPVDLAQGFVAGIGGARTEALLAAPLEVDGLCYAISIVGRGDFTEFDLELLAELADEAAPGLAVAQLVDRVRNC